MTTVSDDPYSLAKHDYETALSRFEHSFELWKNEPALWVRRAHAFLCTGNLSKAYECLQVASKLRVKQDPFPGMFPYDDLLGAVHYLSGRSEKAVQFFRVAAEGVANRIIGYTDAAGGVGFGLQLWYFAHKAGDMENVKFARKYLQGRARRKGLHTNMPGPISDLLFGKTDADALLKEHCGTSSYDEVRRLPKLPAGPRGYAIKIQFYSAFQYRLGGDDIAAQKYFRQCAELENLHSGGEWYLARHECGMKFR